MDNLAARSPRRHGHVSASRRCSCPRRCAPCGTRTGGSGSPPHTHTPDERSMNQTTSPSSSLVLIGDGELATLHRSAAGSELRELSDPT
jgi:hypothetical protein